jgi:hypothetical protein
MTALSMDGRQAVRIIVKRDLKFEEIRGIFIGALNYLIKALHG